MKKRRSTPLFGQRNALPGGILLACLLLSGICIASAVQHNAEDARPAPSPPLLLASAATATEHATTAESHASTAPTLPRRSEKGPRTYPISEVFLSGHVAEPTPTPKPTPPPEAFYKPVLEPYHAPDLFGAPFFDTASSTRTVVPFRLPRPTPRPTPTQTPRVLKTPRPTPSIRKVAPPPTSKRPKITVPTPDDPLDLNSASVVELARVPGLGPHRAKLIVAHRRTIGGFEHLDQLLDVFGISEERFTEAAPVLTLSPYATKKHESRKPDSPPAQATTAEPPKASPSGVLALP